MNLKLKLGTRGSLLAKAQSSWVAREVERLNPGTQVELVEIVTRGDQIQSLPLQKVEGKDFFVAELDQALQLGKVDFTVHSMKDLSLSRPDTLICAAVPNRENPRDVVLFGPQALKRLQEGKTLKVGTSSPRRLENIPDFLVKALPRLADRTPTLEWVEIRGNVNTRLSRVHESETSDRYLDAVVLAFAGLIRLWEDVSGQAELQKLLQGVRWMVLPLRECPTAPAQGALSIECRSSDERLKKILEPLHSKATEQQVGRERSILAEWGGGCHQRMGSTLTNHPVLGDILYTKGVKPDGTPVEYTQWQSPAPFFKKSKGDQKIKAWDGIRWRTSTSSSACEGSADSHNPQAIFIAHSRAANGSEWLKKCKDARVWTSGVASWFRLAEQGVWVEGCAENLGFHTVISTLKLSVLNLPVLAKWVALTHEEGVKDWGELMPAVATYKVGFTYSDDAKAALREANYIFWGSGFQQDELKEFTPIGAHHACGPGKTADRLRQAGLSPVCFPSVEEWRKWLNLGN